MSTPASIMVVATLMLGGCLIAPVLGAAGIIIPFLIFGRTFRGIISTISRGGIASIREGNDGAVSANKRLRRQLDYAIEPVPCPQCGWFQPDMVRETRSRCHAWVDWPVLALLIAAPFFWLVVWQFQMTASLKIFDLDSSGPITPAIAVFGGTSFVVVLLMGGRWLIALSENPNKLRRGSPPPFPDAPLAITEADWAKRMAAQTSRITAVRQTRAAVVNGQRRIVPPRIP